MVLKSHLAGAALKSIQGIPVTADGYIQAVAALKERFQQDDVRRETLMKELLNLPSVRHNDLKAVRSLIDHLSAHTRALRTLGVSSESFASLLLPVAKEKLPEDWRLEWARKESHDFDAFLQFLNQEIRVRESARGVSVPSSSDAHPSPSVPSVTSSLNARREARTVSTRNFQRPQRTCACGQGHQRLDQCDTFRKLPVEDRWKAAKGSKTCFRCLGFGHLAKICNGRPCAECGRQHHSLLHNPDFSPRGPTAPAGGLSPEAVPFTPPRPTNRATRPGDDSNDVTRQNHHRFNVTGMEKCSNFFQTAVVEAIGPKGRRKARVLLDGGADASYIRSSLAEELGLPVTDTGTFSCLGFQEKAEEARKYDKVQVVLENRFDGRSVRLEMWSTEQLCSPLPTAHPPQVPLTLEMADDFGGGDIDLLIGIDNMYRIVLWDQLELSEGLRAIETIFGYVLHGRHDDDEAEGLSRHQRFHSRQGEAMWNLDTIGVTTEKKVAEKDPGSSPQPMRDEEESRNEMGLVWRPEERPASNQDCTLIPTKPMTDRVSQERSDLKDDQLVAMVRDTELERSRPEEDRNRADLEQPRGGNSSTVGRDQERHGLSPASQISGELYHPHLGVYSNRGSYVCWDPGGATLPVCPPSV